MRWSLCIILVWSLCGGRERALAHAPLARSINVTSAGIQLWMPSFGLILHADDPSRRAYAWSALLGLPLEEQRLLWLSGDDGSVWLASQAGLRNVSADGCSTFELRDGWTKRPLAALAKHPKQAGVLYAITSDHPPALYRSQDHGMHWQLASTLADTSPITGLQVVAGESTRMYVSRAGKDSGSVESSRDEGSSWQTVATGSAQDLTLLRVTAGSSDTLWASATAPGTRETRLLMAEQGEFRELKRVRYFGGFAVKEDGSSLWIADETGGLFHSTDHGATFAPLQPALAIACLHFDERADTLWACTPGLADEPALSLSRDHGASFEPGVALAEVSELVRCPAPANVAESCAAAWNEWQADVRMLAGSAPSATPTLPDAGHPVGDARAPTREAGAPERGTSTQPASDGGKAAEADDDQPGLATESGCAVTGSAALSSWLPLGCFLGYAGARRLRRRSCMRAS